MAGKVKVKGEREREVKVMGPSKEGITDLVVGGIVWTALIVGMLCLAIHFGLQQ